jgi:cytochrome c biogenesis factor
VKLLRILVINVALTALFAGLFVGAQVLGSSSFWGWGGNWWYLLPVATGSFCSWLSWWRLRYEMHRIATLALKYLEAAEIAKNMKASAGLN